jgi:hypothetical protein
MAYMAPPQLRKARGLHGYLPGRSPSYLGSIGWRSIAAGSPRLGAHGGHSRRRSLRGLGQDDPFSVPFVDDSVTGGGGIPVYGPPMPGTSEYPAVTIPLQPGGAFDASGNPIPASYTPTIGPLNPAGPAPYAYSNSPTVAQPPGGCALCYATPQAAIAAGVNPQTVSQDWSTFVRGYSTPQAAVAAGIPAGVVTQYWSSGGVTGALNPSTVLMIGGGLLALMLLGGGGGGRGRR